VEKLVFTRASRMTLPALTAARLLPPLVNPAQQSTKRFGTTNLSTRWLSFDICRPVCPMPGWLFGLQKAD
jgi:hypothetical protein